MGSGVECFNTTYPAICGIQREATKQTRTTYPGTLAHGAVLRDGLAVGADAAVAAGVHALEVAARLVGAAVVVRVALVSAS